MAIPESQLQTWASKGSTTQSAATYQVIRNALNAGDAPYAGKDFEVFLQGSYGNDTNVYGTESDVDVVIKLNDTFHYNIDSLPLDQQAAFNSKYPDAASYPFADFRRDVITHLSGKIQGVVKPGNKAIKIPPHGSRRSADVLAAVQFRKYHGITTLTGENFTSGILFFLPDGTYVVNYPKQHSQNLTARHQASRNNLKPLVRILKNCRNRQIDNGKLGKGIAPSYFIEGLLHNVPTEQLVGNYNDMFVGAFNWLWQADRSKFKCASGQHPLLLAGSRTSWPPADCYAFLDAVKDLWNNWS
jgi:hypothetical protein